MPVARRKLKAEPQTKTFHATMLVTRVEDWWVEAESLDEAQALFAAGHGHRAAVGELVHSTSTPCAPTRTFEPL